MIFLVSIRFSFVVMVFGLSEDSLLANAIEIRKLLLQLDDENVTIRQTLRRGT
jgi:hypothetical protein